MAALRSSRSFPRTHRRPVPAADALPARRKSSSVVDGQLVLPDLRLNPSRSHHPLEEFITADEIRSLLGAIGELRRKRLTHAAPPSVRISRTKPANSLAIRESA